MKKNMLSFRSKLELLTVVGVVIILLAGSGIFATNWVISPTSDNKSTFILCSNGNYYTDVTAANLQTAIYSLNGTGGEVTLPACNISITSTLYLTDNVTLHGANKNSSIISLATGSNCDMVNIDRKSNILISNICFNMYNYSQDELANISLIDITGASGNTANNITIRDCLFKNGCVKSMIDCQEYTEYITISNCVFDKRTWYNGVNWGFGAAIWFSGDYCIANNNFIRDTWACGIVLEHSTTVPQIPAAYHIIDGNIITGVIGCGLTMEGSYKSAYAIITNNIFHDLSTSTAYTAIGAIQASNNATVSNNLFYNCGRGVVIPSTGYSVTVDSNVFDALDDYPISNSGKEVVISNNVISDSDANYAILTYRSAQILGNKLYDCVSYGIYCKLSTYYGTIVANNYINRSTGMGIYIDGDGAQYSSLIVSSNYINDVSSDGLHIEDCENGTVYGNVISDTSFANQGIELADCINMTIGFNRIFGFETGIKEDADTSNWNIFIGNNCLGNTIPIDLSATNTVNSTNLGTIS